MAVLPNYGLKLWFKKFIQFFISKLGQLKSSQKTVVVLLFDTMVAACSFYLAVILRQGELLPSFFLIEEFQYCFLLVIFIQGLTFYFTGLYRGVWRYSSTRDLLRIIRGVSFAELFSVIGLFFFDRIQFISRTSFIINWPILIVGLGGGRLLYRILRDHSINNAITEKTKVGIIGIGAEGDQIFREINKNPDLNLEVKVYFDVHNLSKNKILHGIPILCNLDNLELAITKYNIQQIIVADSNFDKDILTRIIQFCRQSNIKLKTLPKLADILSNNAVLHQLRDLAPEDLLKRKIINLDTASLELMIKDATILVTGAGGFIGTEICTQLAKFNPKKIVFFEFSEYNLYELEMKIKDKFPNLNCEIILGDIRDKDKVNFVFEKHRPQVVFHAAALKHVPLTEFNIIEAVKTNVLGTYIVAQASLKYSIDKFILISSDKAINPTSIMGATKRIAEIVCQYFQQNNSRTNFITVRFGNVFASTGSVIPLFIRQIEKGGPVTVTHPEMKRYFMAISEATQLVLQASAIGNSGEIMVLDMGEPIKILDLAKQLIALAGASSNQEIKIEFTCLRPGEKLFEEIISSEEETLPTRHPMVRIAKARNNSKNVKEKIMELFECVCSNDDALAKNLIKSLVPEYLPTSTEDNIQVNKSNSKEILNSNNNSTTSSPNTKHLHLVQTIH